MRESLGLNDLFWLDIEEATDDKRIYASHRNWIEVVRLRPFKMLDNPGLLQLVAQWGRVDVLKDVLKDPELLAQRKPMQVQMAFQGALEHALEPTFDVGLIELLMDHGAKAADVYLPALFGLKQDKFGLFDEIHARRRLRRWKSRMNITLLGKLGRQCTPVSITLWRRRHTGGKIASLPSPRSGPTSVPSPKCSPSRLKVAPQESGAVARRRWHKAGMVASLASERPVQRRASWRANTMGRVAQAVQAERRPSTVRALRRQTLIEEEEDI